MHIEITKSEQWTNTSHTHTQAGKERKHELKSRWGENKSHWLDGSGWLSPDTGMPLKWVDRGVWKAGRLPIPGCCYQEGPVPARDQGRNIAFVFLIIVLALLFSNAPYQCYFSGKRGARVHHELLPCSLRMVIAPTWEVPSSSEHQLKKKEPCLLVFCPKLCCFTPAICRVTGASHWDLPESNNTEMSANHGLYSMSFPDCYVVWKIKHNGEINGFWIRRNHWK